MAYKKTSDDKDTFKAVFVVVTRQLEPRKIAKRINFICSLARRSNASDECLRVGMPFYTIHGNHDDLSGANLTALDPLHEAGLVNLFGKHIESERISVRFIGEFID